MLYKTLNVQAADALNATSVVNTIALINGASILRVHDVREAVEAIEFYKLVKPWLKSRTEGVGIFILAKIIERNFKSAHAKWSLNKSDVL